MRSTCRPGGDGHRHWQERAALLTPIAKAFSTDVGVDVASLGVQVHGGMGFIEETGAAQLLSATPASRRSTRAPTASRRSTSSPASCDRFFAAENLLAETAALRDRVVNGAASLAAARILLA
jgi:hypothetical protein